MNANNSAFDQLDHLLATKAFDALSESELNLVLQHFDSASEYEAMRQTMPQLQQAVSDDQIALSKDPGELQRLLNRLEVVPKSTPNVKHGSVFGLLAGLIPGKLAGLKAGLMAVTVLGLMWVGEPGNVTNEGARIDSTATLSDTFAPSFLDSSTVGFQTLRLN